MNKFLNLRKDYKLFIYDSFSKNIENDFLVIRYKFIQSDDIVFEPEISFPAGNIKNTDISFLDAAIFNLGMIELISYYKACCSPKIIIKAGFLSEDQLNFWKDIYFNGLGEFLYVNNIVTTKNDLFEIKIESENVLAPADNYLSDGSIIPVGGGKDSAVSLELLALQDILSLVLNPKKASLDCIKNSGCVNYFQINRKIDHKLLELNEKGFLNGHTPFSALLAFATALAGLITGRKNIVLSNENSASEGNAFFSGIEVNHQYSKSFNAEKSLHDYISAYIHKDLNYFSFLRPINELKIAQLFSGFKNHFPDFRSCNAGSKNNIWCNKCSKCLFTYIILSPFISREDLIKIFGTDMFEDKSLESIYLQLTGLKGIKPFECVGTSAEVNSALAKTIIKMNKKDLPYLLELFLKINQSDIGFHLEQFDKILNEFNENNLLNNHFKNILIKNL